MKTTLSILLALIAFALLTEAALSHERFAFRSWMRQYQKSYKNEDEFQFRYSIWKKNADFIRKHNSQDHSFTVALNKFADLTNAEFQAQYLGLKTGVEGPKGRDHFIPSSEPEGAPASFDWRTKNAVTAIKNQGQCGSCWSFSTTGSTEGCHSIKTGKLVSLSEQNLMDCSTSYGNQGCDGGLMSLAFEYIINNKGIDTEQSYPYTAEDGTSCNYTTANIGATLVSYVNVTSGDEDDLLSEAVNGPVSVAIDASQDSFQFYSSGVYSDSGCGNTPSSLDHGVLVVGWGAQNGSDYWIVKNSWGEDWGLNGYILMARNDNNMCGIATMASRPNC